MNGNDFLAAPVAQAIGWALLHLLWQGALVAGILAAGLALLRNRSAQTRYAAACAALALLPVLFVATAVRSYKAPSKPLPLLQLQARGVEAAETVTNVRVEPMPTPLLERAATMTRAWLPRIVLAWLIGVTLFSLRLCISWMRAMRLAKRAAKPAPLAWQRSVAFLASAMNLRRAVQLLESTAVEVPAVIGWLRPVILVPASALAGLSVEQLEMVLAHELAHIRRHDFVVNLLQSLVETLMFYHPAVWWMSRRVRVERENCCDDLAVATCGDALQYARALTRLEELRASAPAMAMAANGGSLLGRIRRLVASPADLNGSPSRWAAGAAVLSAVVVLLAIPASPLLAERETAKAKPDAKAKAAKPTRTERTYRDGDATTHEVVVVSPDGTRRDVTRETITDHERSSTSSTVDVHADSNSDDDDYDYDEDADISIAPMAPMTPMTPITPVISITPAPAVAIAPMAISVGTPTPIAAPAPAASAVPSTPPAPHVRLARPGHRISVNGQISVDDLIAMRSVGVTPEYIQQMREMNLGDLPLDDVIAMRVQGVTPKFIRDLRDAGLNVHDAGAVIGLAVQGACADYVRELRDAGVDVSDTDSVIALRVQGVSPKYVRELRDAGYDKLSAKNLVALRVQGVNGKFVRSLSDAGYKNLSVDDLIRLAASGVDADYIRELAKYKN